MTFYLRNLTKKNPTKQWTIIGGVAGKNNFFSTSAARTDAAHHEPLPLTKIEKKIGFIGDGNMAKAICKGIEQKGLINYSQIYVSSPYAKNLNVWKDMGANTTTEEAEVALECDVVFLAVKPNVLAGALDNIVAHPKAAQITNKLFISILAGFTLEMLEARFARLPGSRLVRVMPNIPMVVGAGCTVYCPGTNVTEDDLAVVRAILEATGMSTQVPEHLINTVCAVSSSGPAFVYLFIEALSDGGVKMGLHRGMATQFAAQTVLGAAKVVLETGKHMGTLKDEVCSAGGTTIAGLHALETGAVRGAVMSAVEEAVKRAAELGKLK